MARHVQGPDGKMRGSIGDGKDRTPQPQTRRANTSTVEPEVDMAARLEAARLRMIDSLTSSFFTSEEAEDFGGLWGGPPEQFTGLCEHVNGGFVEYAERAGVNVELTDWSRKGDGFPHTVAEMDGYVVDFTLRQLDPDADVPTVVPVAEWQQEWNRPHERTVQTLRGDMNVDLHGPISDSTREAYLNGQCFALATAVAEQRGCDVAVFIADHEDEVPWGTRYDDPDHTLDLDHDWFNSAVHAAALVDDDTAVDIDGERDVAGWEEEMRDIHAGSMVRMSPGRLRRLVAVASTTVEQDYDAAHVVARLIP